MEGDRDGQRRQRPTTQGGSPSQTPGYPGHSSGYFSQASRLPVQEQGDTCGPPNVIRAAPPVGEDSPHSTEIQRRRDITAELPSIDLHADTQARKQSDVTSANSGSRINTRSQTTDNSGRSLPTDTERRRSSTQPYRRANSETQQKYVGFSEHCSSYSRDQSSGNQPPTTRLSTIQDRRSTRSRSRSSNQGLPPDADLIWRGIPGDTEQTSRKRVLVGESSLGSVESRAPGLNQGHEGPGSLGPADCYECIGWLLDNTTFDRRKKQAIIGILGLSSSDFSWKTIKGVAEAHLPRSQMEIDDLCYGSNMSNNRRHETCVHKVLNDMKTEGKKLGHLVEYFSQDDTKRKDVLKAVAEIHQGCGFCALRFQKL